MVREFILFRALDDIVQDQRTTKGFAGREARLRRQSTGGLEYSRLDEFDVLVLGRLLVQDLLDLQREALARPEIVDFVEPTFRVHGC